MAYTPTIWKDGDTITAEKMNHLEQGVQNQQVGPKGEKGDKGDPGSPGVTMEEVNAAIQEALEGGSGPATEEYTVTIKYTSSTDFSSIWTTTLDGAALVNGTKTFNKKIVKLVMLCENKYTLTGTYGKTYSIKLNNDIVLSYTIPQKGTVDAGTSKSVDIDISNYADSTLTINCSA